MKRITVAQELDLGGESSEECQRPVFFRDRHWTGTEVPCGSLVSLAHRCMTNYAKLLALAYRVLSIKIWYKPGCNDSLLLDTGFNAINTSQYKHCSHIYAIFVLCVLHIGACIHLASCCVPFCTLCLYMGVPCSVVWQASCSGWAVVDAAIVSWRSTSCWLQTRIPQMF